MPIYQKIHCAYVTGMVSCWSRGTTFWVISKIMLLPPPQKKLLQSIVKCKAWAENVTILDWQIDSGNFLGGPKYFHESVGGHFKTWWGQHHDFMKWPKKLHPYLLMVRNLFLLRTVIIFKGLLSLFVLATFNKENWLLMEHQGLTEDSWGTYRISF